MPTGNLTVAVLRGLTHDDGEIVNIKSGLIVRADRRGVVTFSFRYRAAGTRRRVVLGRFPALTLADARAAAGRVREQVRNGDDPQAERRATSRVLSFDALADLYVEQYAKRQKSSWKLDVGFLRHARRAWGGRSAATITRQDAARLLFDLVARAPVTANRLRSVLARLFSWAVDSALLADTPMLGVRKPHREGRGKTRVLDDGEIKGLWRALEAPGVDPGVAAALKVLLLLGQRPGEICGMTVAELHQLDDADNARWELAPERTKSRRVHIVPLPPLAREIITAEIARRARPRFVFMSRRARGRHLDRGSMSMALSGIIRRLNAASLLANRPTPHDLRRSLATGLSRLGIPRENRLAVLGHSHGDVHEIYDRHDRLAEKRAALTAWEQHVRTVLR